MVALGRSDLAETGEQLASESSQDLVGIVELAAALTGAPRAAINLVNEAEQRALATYGFSRPGVMNPKQTLCGVTVAQGTSVVVSDASADSRFADLPAVNGEMASFRMYAGQPLSGDDGRVFGTLCVYSEDVGSLDEQAERGLRVLADRVVDVLELERSNQELREAREKLAATNERLTEFASQVSHDLRAPLAAATMSVGLIHEELASVPERNEKLGQLIDVTSRGLDRMERFIERSLAYANGFDSTNIDRTHVSLSRVTDNVLADLSHVASATGAVVEREDPMADVWADETLVHAVVQNLAQNALKFVNPGEYPELLIRTREHHGMVRFEVLDRGCGIGECDADEVFTLRVRGNSGSEGHGIGLSTARGYVEALGGRIGLESRDGGGTVAWFELPRVRTAPS